MTFHNTYMESVQRFSCRKKATYLFSLTGLCTVIFAYSLIGAFIFEALEANNERKTKTEVGAETEKFIKNVWLMNTRFEILNENSWSHNVTNFLIEYEIKLLKAVQMDGYDGNEETECLHWSFVGSLMYSIIVITTIGYGDIVPRTHFGKIFTMLYGVVGIPLTLFCISKISDAMADLLRFIYSTIFGQLFSNVKSQTRKRSPHHISERSSTHPSLRRNPSYYAAINGGFFYDHKTSMKSNKCALHPMENTDHQHHMHTHRSRNSTARQLNRMEETFLPLKDEFKYDVAEPEKDDDDNNEKQASVPIMFCVSIIIIYICGGATLFCYWEKWKFFDSFYFCFITLTTIGFGDMVPDAAVLSEDAHLAMGLCFLYLLFGMALIGMFFKLLQEEITKLMTSIGKKIEILSDEDDAHT